MQKITCPKCGEVFQIDEAGYAQILQQVRDKEFEKELKSRESQLSEKNASELKAALIEKESEFKDELTDKDKEIAELKAQLDKADAEKKLAITEALSAKDKEIAEKNQEISNLENKLDLQEEKSKLSEKTLKEKYKGEIELREEEIERLKDFKAKQSTKMVGESLEQYCKTQFDQIRMTAFPDAYFEKDNDAGKDETKGDFIFRDYSDGVEFISIMFEMKNEMETTDKKHKNEDFFQKLDKDRTKKNCEYAVLVSTLESDNDLYNNGIVDVSYKYPKMFVVRPQFFIPIISLLRNAAMNSLDYRKKLIEVQSQQIDLVNFEDNLTTFKDSFLRSFRLASERYDDAIKGIDNAIKTLTAIRENLVLSEKHLNTANNKLDDVNVKKLTKNAPSVQAMFDEIKDEKTKKLPKSKD